MESDNGFIRPDSLSDSQGGKFVVLGDEKKRPPTVDGPAEDVNLVPFFTQDELQNIGERAWQRYVADVRSRAPRMAKLREFMEIYASVLKPKRFPYQNAANVNLPILTYPMLQVQARLYDMLWPENGKVLYSAPADVQDMNRAAATEKFANSYIRTKMPEMEQGLDDTLAQFCAFGSGFRRTYWDSYEGRVRSDWVPIEDFVAPNWYRCQDPSLRGVPRYTLVHHMTIADLEAYGDAGVFENVDGLDVADRGETASAEELRRTAEKIDGTDGGKMDSDDPDQARMVLEQHCRLRLPNRKGGKKGHAAFDGKNHYVIVSFDDPTKRVFRIVLREEEDPEDAKRFEKESAAHASYQAQRELFDQASAQLGQFMTIADQLGKPVPTDLPMPPAPVPPLGTDKGGEPIEPRPTRKREICFFTHYKAFWSEGFYGLGFGDFLAPLAKAGNALLNEHINGVTLRNAKPGFISRSLRGPRGSIEIQPGKLTEVDAPPEALDRGIKWMDPPPNDPTTMPLIRLVLELGDKLSGSADLMSGSTSGSNRTAKEIQILNAQLMKQISVLARRVKGAFKHELDKIWRCWGVFLPDEPEATPVVDPATGQPEEIQISRKMFIPDARVMPACDPRMRFEKVEEANNKFGLVMNNPMLAQNPMAMFIATEEVLRANDGDRILAALQPPQPPVPPQPKQGWEEEADWLRNGDPPVTPTDDDLGHLQSHQAFLASGPAQLMTKEQRDRAENHLRFHAAATIQKRGAAMLGQPPGGPPPREPIPAPGPPPSFPPGSTPGGPGGGELTGGPPNGAPA